MKTVCQYEVVAFGGESSCCFQIRESQDGTINTLQNMVVQVVHPIWKNETA